MNFPLVSAWIPCLSSQFTQVFQEPPVGSHACDFSVFLFRVSLSDGSDSESSSASSPLHHEPPPPLLKTNNNQVSCGVPAFQDSVELVVITSTHTHFLPLKFKQSPF